MDWQGLCAALRASFGQVFVRKVDLRTRAAIEKLNLATDAALRKPTLADVLDQIVKDRH